MRWKRIDTIVAAGSIVGIALLAGCGTGGGANGGARRALTYDDFVRPDATMQASAENEVESEITDPDDPISDVPISGEGPDVAIADGNEPDWTESAAQIQPGERIIVDSLVGEINGQPVYANRFFAPIDDRLRRAREELTDEQFKAALEEAVGARMADLVQNDVLLAYAESQLTPDQQRGLLAFLAQTRENIVSGFGGSREVARQRLQEEEGLEGIDAKVGEERNRALLQMLLQREVAPRVIVSWKDIERQYQREFAKYNPPALATLAGIRLTPGTDDARIETVKQQLASRVPFLEIAKSMRMLRDGLLNEPDQPYVLGPRGLADAVGLIELYREKLDGLSVGDTTEPFTQPLRNGGEWIVWLHVVKIEQPPGRSLYEPEVQLEIRQRLTQQEFLNEQNRFLQRLLDEKIVEDLKIMQSRMFEVGKLRYAVK